MLKVGILGGGQLGRMLLQAAANYQVETFVMEKDVDCPAAHLCHHFVKGDITNEEDVIAFGKNLDAVTIEIESVSVRGLEKLREMGVKVYPSPEALNIIKNKIRQKEFYKSHQIPTAPFVITENIDNVRSHKEFLPAVHKLAEGGYDGRGVQILTDEKDFENAFSQPAVLEKQVNIKKEIAIIIAVAQDGKTAIYPPSEMIFDPHLNLLLYQLSPAIIPEKILWKAEAMALAVVKNLQSAGIFAVELFIDQNDDVWVNETAPRVHNSGHHTIEGNFSSQFDMVWRIILGLPLGNTRKITDTALVNLIGIEGDGKVDEQVWQIAQLDNAFLHLYGKKESRPGRKMGHVNILSADRSELVHLANKVHHLWNKKYYEKGEEK